MGEFVHHSNDTSPDLLSFENSDLTGTLLRNLAHSFNGVLQPLLLSKLTFLISLVVLFMWHISDWCVKKMIGNGCCRDASITRMQEYERDPTIRTFCHSVIVLNIYYGDLPVLRLFHAPFMLSVFFLFWDTNFFWAGSKVMNYVQPGKDWIIAEKIPTVEEALYLKVRNRYQMVSMSFFKASLYFYAQVILVLYYIYVLNGDKETKTLDRLNPEAAGGPKIFQWFVAVVLTIIAGENEVGSAFQWDFWRALLRAPFADEHGFFLFCCPIRKKTEWQIRQFYSYMVNQLFRVILLGTAPILLSTSDLLDFIKDCMAIFYITRLDDLDDWRTLGKELDALVTHKKGYCESTWGKYDNYSRFNQPAQSTADVTSRTIELQPSSSVPLLAEEVP